MVCSRAYVQEGVYDKFVEAYRDAMEARAKGMVDRALEQGDMKLLTSGKPVGDKVCQLDNQSL